MKLLSRLSGRKKPAPFAATKAYLARFDDAAYLKALEKKPLAELEKIKALLTPEMNSDIATYLKPGRWQVTSKQNGKIQSWEMITSGVTLCVLAIVMPTPASVFPWAYLPIAVFLPMFDAARRLLFANTTAKREEMVERAQRALDTLIAPKRALIAEIEAKTTEVRETLGEKAAAVFAARMKEKHGLNETLQLDAPAVKGYLPAPKESKL